MPHALHILFFLTELLKGAKTKFHTHTHEDMNENYSFNHYLNYVNTKFKLGSLALNNKWSKHLQSSKKQIMDNSTNLSPGHPDAFLPSQGLAIEIKPHFSFLFIWMNIPNKLLTDLKHSMH